MDKRLIDHVWKHCLPKEFKEEVKKIYIAYMKRQQISNQDNLLDSLFGSKCLPDNVDSLNRNVDSSEPQPAEPKFKRCERVITPSGEVCIIEDSHFENGSWLYLVGDPARWFSESDLEPYTEPKKKHHVSVKEACEILGVDESEATKLVKSKPKNGYSERLRAESVEESRIANEESYLRNLSQETANCDKHLDTILKDSFRNEKRLNIAAMITQGIMANPSPQMVEMDVHRVADLSILMADTLIAKAEKGDNQ